MMPPRPAAPTPVCPKGGGGAGARSRKTSPRLEFCQHCMPHQRASHSSLGGTGPSYAPHRVRSRQFPSSRIARPAPRCSRLRTPCSARTAPRASYHEAKLSVRLTNLSPVGVFFSVRGPLSSNPGQRAPPAARPSDPHRFSARPVFLPWLRAMPPTLTIGAARGRRGGRLEHGECSAGAGAHAAPRRPSLTLCRRKVGLAHFLCLSCGRHLPDFLTVALLPAGATALGPHAGRRAGRLAWGLGVAPSALFPF